MMKRIVCILTGAFASALCGADAVGVKVDSIAVPAEAITVPIASVTVSEESVRCSADESALRQKAIAQVREAGSEEERVRALNGLWHQDDLFYLIFKPGEDRSATVRVAAVGRLAEIDVLKAIGEKMTISEVSDAIKSRIDGVYTDKRDQKSIIAPSVVRQYVRRLRSRL